jgi:hypothetical protein
MSIKLVNIPTKAMWPWINASLINDKISFLGKWSHLFFLFIGVPCSLEFLVQSNFFSPFWLFKVLSWPFPKVSYCLCVLSKFLCGMCQSSQAMKRRENTSNLITFDGSKLLLSMNHISIAFLWFDFSYYFSCIM